LTTSEYNNRHG